MSINLFIFEFYRIFKPTMLWTFFISLFIYIDMILFKEMIDSGMFDQVIKMMKNPFISNMVEAMGVNPSQMTDALGFYAIRNTIVTMLMGGIYAVITSSSLTAREESEGTMEFLLSRPVTRVEILNSKLTAFHINLLLLNIISSIVGYISLEVYKFNDYNFDSYIVLCIYTYLLQLMFSGIGLFLSLLMKRGRVFLGAIIGIVMGTYLLEIISKITESAKFLGYFSPFYFADKDVLSKGYGLETENLIYFIAGTFILIILSYILFKKKDIV